MSQDSFGSSDLCKTLFKNALDISQKLAEVYRQTKVYADVTSPQAVLLRGQLKDLCQRIMLESPCEYGAKAEDFVWRKVFYEPIQLLKKFQRRSVLANDMGLATAIKIQVMSAMGFYQTLLVSLQTRYSLDLRNIVDIPVVHEPLLYHKNLSSHFVVVVDKETRDAVMDLCYRALVCLGNLSRYQCDYLDDWTKTLPTRYYLQALLLKPDTGLPHNQLALLAGSRIVEGAYHWLLCICSKEPFLPAKKNLLDVLGRVHKRVSAMRRTSTTSMKAICSQLMSIVYQFLSLSDSHRTVSDQVLDNLRSASEHALSNFRNYLLKCVHSVLSSGNDASSKRRQRSSGSKVLPPDLLFKLVVVFQAVVFLLEKQQDKASSKAASSLFSLAVAVSLAMHSSALQFFRNRIYFRTGIEPASTANRSNEAKTNESGQGNEGTKTVKQADAKSVLKKPRRRRNDIAMWNEFESDDNESESADCIHPIKEEIEDENEDDERSDRSGDENFSLSSCESSVGGYESSVDGDQGDSNSKTGGKSVGSSTSGYEKMTPYDALIEEPWLPALKIICDWLSSNRHILSMIPSLRYLPEQTQSLWPNICDVVNSLPPVQLVLGLGGDKIRPVIYSHVECVASTSADVITKWTQHFVLPEDRAIGRFPALSKAHAGIETSPSSPACLTRVLNIQESLALRVAVIYHFSRSMTNDWLDYSVVNNRFSVKDFHAAPRHLNSSAAATSANGGVEDERFFTDRPTEETFSITRSKDSEAKHQQMKAMAELWLKSEISRLERQQVSSGGSSSAVIPIYAVLVGDVFLQLSGVNAVRSLLASQRLIVVLPHAIITHLDMEKTSKPAAREASRFLEGELRKGSPYLKVFQNPEAKSTSEWNKRVGETSTDFRTLPAVFNVVRQLLSENINVPSVSRCLVAIVSLSTLSEVPVEVGKYVDEEIRKLPNNGNCVQFRSIKSLLADVSAQTASSD